MKKKLSSKNGAKNQPAPPQSAWIVSHGKFKEGDKLPEPDYPPLPTSVELEARKLFPEVDEKAPKWAKLAVKMGVASVMPPTRKRKASEKYLEGFSAGELFATDDILIKLISKYGGLSDCEIALKLPSDQRADFFCGFRDGEKFIREMPNRAKVIQTVKAYQAIAGGWREARKHEGNAGQLHQWLIDKGSIHFRTDPAATRKICRIIGFPTRGKAGRPQEEK